MASDDNQTNVQMQMHLQSQRQQMRQQQLQLHAFWQQQIQEIAQIDANAYDFKTHQLPLARIKKIMKADEEVRMISAEAPVLFAKACEMFILEMSLRAWIHTEENKRRTLQRNDIAMAISKTDVFDFLIDIVPRDDIKPTKKGAVSDPNLIYQQQFQQQQAAMIQQMIQQQTQAAVTGTASATSMPWAANPQLQQQLIQQFQQRMAVINGSNAPLQQAQSTTMHDETNAQNSTTGQDSVDV